MNPLHLLYRWLARAAAPVMRARLKRRARDFPELAARSPERAGRVPAGGEELWIHAASAGEVNATAILIRALIERFPETRMVLSTTTHTGALRAAAMFGDEPRIRHVFAPLDSPGAVARWLDRTRPRAGLVVETEIWPELFRACAARGIGLALVNARVSERAFAGYRRLKGLFAPALAAVDLALCQSSADGDRLEALGLPAGRVHVTGNLKFDLALPPDLDRQAAALAARWTARPAWVAGSTHPGEETLVLRAHAGLRRARPETLLVLAPRHPERAGKVLAEARRAGLESVLLGDDDGPIDGSVAVVVVERMGGLAVCYRAATAAFVGGSLVEGIGGHNLLEPAAAGRPVVTGPHTADQAAAREALSQAGALAVVEDAGGLAREVSALLADPDRAAAMGAAGADCLAARRGALARSLEILEPWLEGEGLGRGARG